MFKQRMTNHVQKVNGINQISTTSQKQLKRNLSDYTDILTLLLAEVEMPAKARPFVDAVLGASEAREGWFELNDFEMGKRFPTRKQYCGTDSIKKRSQRYRKPLEIWQIESGIELIEIQHGGKRQDEEYPTRYKTDKLLDAWAEAVNLAKQSVGWKVNPMKAKKNAARTVAKKLIGTHIFSSRGNMRRTDDVTELTRSMKSAATHMRKTFEYALRSGHNVESIREELNRKIDVAFYQAVHGQ
jgi:hypothetical protein